MVESRSSEKYSCDACRSSKVACSRESLHCSRCAGKNLQCVYSRSGIIRRRTTRKRTSNHASLNTSTTPSLDSDAEDLDNSMRDVESHLEDDVTMTQQHLGGMSDIVPMDALSSLSTACSRFTLGTRRNASNMRANGFHDMSEHMEVSFQALNSAGAPNSWLSDAPLNVKTLLQSGQPQKVHDSAWLVIYYASMVSNTSINPSLRTKIQDNLWLALSDARVLLEPSELNIRAILMVLSDAVTMTTPTMCWMLASTACRMYSSLGSNITKSPSVGMDKKRRNLFWHLNLMDKAFAIIFRKSPTFNRKMIREIGPPTVQEFLPTTDKISGGLADAVGVFTAHYVHQKVLLSYLMHDIWTYLYDEESSELSRIDVLLGNLKAWYDEAWKVLEASSLTERPFSTDDHVESMAVGRCAIDFHYTYLVTILTKASANHHELCLKTSELLLNGLKKIPCLPNQPYQPFLWQLLCCPFTPFLVLFRSIVTSAEEEAMQNQDALDAMGQLPEYLEQAKFITPLANKLQDVANVFLQYATTFIANQRTGARQFTAAGALPTPEYHLSMDTSLPMGTGDCFDFNESMKTLNTCTDTLRFDDGGLFDWLDWEEETHFTLV